MSASPEKSDLPLSAERENPRRVLEALGEEGRKMYFEVLVKSSFRNLLSHGIDNGNPKSTLAQIDFACALELLLLPELETLLEILEAEYARQNPESLLTRIEYFLRFAFSKLLPGIIEPNKTSGIEEALRCILARQIFERLTVIVTAEMAERTSSERKGTHGFDVAVSEG